PGDGATAGDNPRGSHAFSPDSHDQPGGDSRSLAAGLRRRTRRPDAAAAGHHGHRRLDREHALHPPGDPGGLSGLGKEEIQAAGGCLESGRTDRTNRDLSNRSRKMNRLTPSSRATTLAFALLIGTGGAAWAEPTLELVQTIVLQGKPGKLDHLIVDSKSQRLFLANKVNNTVDIVDLKGGKLIKQLTGQARAQGVAYSPDLG